MHASVELHAICKRFGAHTVLDNVSLSVKASEFFSLLGPSGCGKTTLLRLIGGFELATSGTVLIDGQPVNDLPPERRPTNTVFQSYALFPHLSVADNVGYGLRALKLPKSEQAHIIAECLEMVRLSAFAGRRPHALSGGQRQRVALARALAPRPKVLLLDEPLSALDKQLREQMQLELRRIQRQVGITFIFVTHDQEEALALSDRMAVMSQGRVLQLDTPARIYETPANREVAAFIGSMNFFAGVIEAIDGDIAHVRCEGKGVLKASITNAHGRAKPGDEASVAVRPEKILLGNTGSEHDNHLSGTLAGSAYYGHHHHLHMQMTDGTTVLISAAHASPADSAVIARFRPEDAIILPKTGNGDGV